MATKSPAWDFDYEGVAQFGTFGSDQIRAWTLASDTGYALPTLPFWPRFSIKADISSGDNPQSNTAGGPAFDLPDTTRTRGAPPWLFKGGNR